MKYRNKITEVDGIKFHSKAEATRYQELKLLERGKAIRSLTLQPRFELNFGDHKICTYVGDFEYYRKVSEKVADGRITTDWEYVVEDVKGMKTPAYNLKKKLMKAIHRIEIQEIGGSRRGTKRRKTTK